MRFDAGGNGILKCCLLALAIGDTEAGSDGSERRSVSDRTADLGVNFGNQQRPFGIGETHIDLGKLQLIKVARPLWGGYRLAASQGNCR